MEQNERIGGSVKKVEVVEVAFDKTKKKRSCAFCKKPFLVNRKSKRKYCSEECREKGRRLTVAAAAKRSSKSSFPGKDNDGGLSKSRRGPKPSGSVDPYFLRRGDPSKVYRKSDVFSFSA